MILHLTEDARFMQVTITEREMTLYEPDPSALPLRFDLPDGSQVDLVRESYDPASRATTFEYRLPVATWARLLGSRERSRPRFVDLADLVNP